LALYSDEQEALYQEIQEVEPDAEADIPYKAFPKFKRVMAVLQETLRMYPSVIGIPKMLNTQEDTIIPCSERGPYGQTQLFVPKGTHMSIDVQSLHHDPDYWPEPEVFKPDRFLTTTPDDVSREAFIPFSAGARSCVGQKFAQVEIVAILVNLCRSYRIKILPKDDVKGETREERQTRLLRNVSRLTSTPLNLGLAFEKR